MAQQTLQTIITLSGRVDNSFGQIGEVLTSLGTQINGLSRQIIDFGKESLETYASYDDTMREVQAVGGYTAAEISELDALNRQIAQTSTYTNLQSAEAMLLIAQAGLDVQDTYAILPSVLDLAMAGNLDLADSVDYLLSSLTSMGYGMEYAQTLTDQMAKTAAIGMTDIDTLGESMMSLGRASGEFFSSSEEILTILSAMSQFGHDQRGAQAGTWLRNFMLSLAAPSSSVDDLVDAMEQLGMAQDEIDEYAANHSNGVAAMAVESLVEQGLRIYDDQGKLLPAIEIIKSLRDTVRGSAEYSEDLTELTGALNAAGGDIDAFLSNTEGLSDNALYNIFARIFGKRGITTAMNLISISDEEWDEIMGQIVNSDGFAESMSETMQGGIGGALRELEASYTEFQTTVGEHIADDLEPLVDGVSDILTGISNMDETTLDALVSGVSVIAAAGPGLMLAGGAFRLIGYLLTPTGAIGLGLTALVAAAAALKELEEADFADNFGNLQLDPTSLTAYVDSLGSSFETAYADVNEFNTALEEAVTQYTTASETFKSNIISDMLTGATLTDEDISTLESLGDQMHAAIVSGIENNYAADMQTITNAFGGLEEAQGNSTWSHIIQILEIGYDNAISRAEELSQDLRDAMTGAFADGKLTGEEVANIQAIFDEMNELMAMQTNADNYAAQQQLLRKAQTMGLDSLQELSEMELQRQEEVMESLYEMQDNAYGQLAAQLDYEVANGTVLEDGTVVTREYADQLLAELKAQQEAEAAGYHLNFLPFTMGLYEEAIGSSDLGDTWEALRSFADSALAKGTVTESDYNAYSALDQQDRDQVAKLAGWYVDALGGYERIQSDIVALQDMQGKTAEQQAEDAATANRLMQILAMYDLSMLSGYGGLVSDEQASSYAAVNGYSVEDARAQSEALDADSGGMAELAWDYMRDAIERGYSFDFENLMSGNMTDTGFQSGIDSIVARLKEVYDFSAIEVPKGLEKIGDYYAAYQLMYGDLNPDDYLIQAQVEPVMEEGAVQEAAGDQQVVADVVAEMPAESGELEVPTSVTGADEAAQAAHAEAQSVMDDPLSQDVNVSDGGSATATKSTIASVFSAPITQWINVTQRSTGASSKRFSLFAEGGRADEASIFGEAGPEWAIPEEHSERTASLLDAARQASGFTWPELIERNGGLNAGGDNMPRQLIYSPTIIANDANGVEQKLIEDKARLDKWFREKQLRDDVEIYT